MDDKKGFFDGNPKMVFVFGLVTGIAMVSLLGGGIQLPELKAKDSDVVRTFDTEDDAGNAVAAELDPVTSDDHIRGDLQKAKVVLVEYSDYECPFCGRHHPTMQQVLDEYGDDVAWVYRHFPLSFHPQAQPAAEAAECAAEQGKFWEFTDILYENQEGLGDDFYFSTAKDLKLKEKQFKDCYESGKYADVVAEDLQSGSRAGVQGTPATFVNGILVSGAVPYETLKDAIDQALGQ